MLKSFLSSYGYYPFQGGMTMERFTKDAMSYLLLHVIDAMRTVYQWKPQYRVHQDLNILADELWNFEKP